MLSGCAQWKINQPPSLRENERAWRDGMGGLVVLLLAERAPSEGPRSTRASRIDQVTLEKIK
jgi:hypothetical protein